MPTMLSPPTTTNKRLAATELAEQGFKILPITPGDKRPPLISGGYKGASNDPSLVSTWWAKWPEANIAMATGQINGVMVLDHDWRNGADTDDLHPTWNKTLAVATPNGLHAYYQCPDPQKTCAELDGIGLKADGGYVLVPPSTRSDSKYDYEWFKTLAPLQLPIGYLDRFTPATVYRRLPAELQHRVDRQRTTAIIRVRERYAREWADAGLRKQKEYLDKSRVGRRNWQLNISAFALAQIVAIGRLAELTVISVLTEAALSVGLTPAETRATIASGMSRGRLFPRRVIFV